MSIGEAVAHRCGSLRVAYTRCRGAGLQQNNSQRCRPVAQKRQPTTTTTPRPSQRRTKETTTKPPATPPRRRCGRAAWSTPARAARPKIPTHVAVLKDIHGADYSTLLKCPLDDRTEHPCGQKGERQARRDGSARAVWDRVLRERLHELVPARHADGLDSLFNGGRAPAEPPASLVLGKAEAQ